MTKKIKKIKEAVVVDKEMFMLALEALHVYHGELLANMDVAVEYGEDDEWLSDLQGQIDIVEAIYNSFVNCMDGSDTFGTGSTTLN